MPDTMGLKTAFKAYKRREITNGKPESTLPGLEMLNNDQIFFLSSANVRILIKNKTFLRCMLCFSCVFNLIFSSLSLSYGVKPEIPKR